MVKKKTKPEGVRFEFHGEMVENQGAHKHFRAHPKDLAGKTIERFEVYGDNAFGLFFTDGTSVALEAECVGPYNIPIMTFCHQPEQTKEEETSERSLGSTN